MSISDGSIYTDASCPSWMDSNLNNAYSNNLFTAVGSGNDGSTTGIGYPACSPYSISVGATNKDDTIRLSSNRGPNLDLLAPGSGINTTNLGGGYTFASGTSMAAPHVAAGALLLKQFRELNEMDSVSGIQNTMQNLRKAP